jgi:type III secretion protein R
VNSSTLQTVGIVAAFSLLPFLLVMVTSFVKISVVLSLLRNAIGTRDVPSTMVVTGLALVLTLVVMAPVGADIYQAAQPDLQREAWADAAGHASAPLRTFLTKHSHDKDRQTFAELSAKLWAGRPGAPGENDLLVLAPAFVTSELKAAFAFGFLLLLPFLIVDLLVSSVLASVGMNGLPPSTVALPFKLLLFVLVDGWLLLARGLILGYG